VDAGVEKLAKFLDLSGSGRYRVACGGRFAEEDRRATDGFGVGALAKNI
jgi:hypothetical protein